jgi:hypothetical protein
MKAAEPTEVVAYDKVAAYDVEDVQKEARQRAKHFC